MITVTTKKGAKFTGKKEGSTLIINGAKFYITDTTLFTSSDEDAEIFLKSMGMSGKQQIRLELSYEEYRRINKILMPKVEKFYVDKETRLNALFQKAKETGQPQLISTNSYETSGNYIQVVNKSTYAMPDGTKKTVTENTH